MQFVLNENNISFEEFSRLFPTESKLLVKKLDESVEIIVDEGQALFSLKYKDFNPIKINIESILERHKTFFYKKSYQKDLLARAIGLKKGKRKPRVLDTTAGMMGDSLLIYSYGVEKLVCFERNPIIAALGINATRNSTASIDFKFGEYLKSEYEDEEIENFDVIFYDPMYQGKNNKTAPKKEMEIFRSIVGVDEDIYKTACALKEKALERLVVKRSNKAIPVINNPSHTIKGKSTSYDVYL